MSDTPRAAEIDPEQQIWPGRDGALVDCREKLFVLGQNQAELTQCLRDTFEDAVLMGVDPEALRRLMHRLVDCLSDPKAVSKTP